MFFGSWVLARGTKLQKFAFNRDPERAFLGLLASRAISDGEHRLLTEKLLECFSPRQRSRRDPVRARLSLPTS
ncbi:MAG: hypothetical protein ABIJ09_01670 [Pseudomonadota bacterium]